MVACDLSYFPDFLCCCHVTGSELQKGNSVSPDDDVFLHLARTYSFTHGSMRKGDSCFDSQDFPDGITNGYKWYQLPGESLMVFTGTSNQMSIYKCPTSTVAEPWSHAFHHGPLHLPLSLCLLFSPSPPLTPFLFSSPSSLLVLLLFLLSSPSPLQVACRTITMCGPSVWRSPWSCPAVSSLQRRTS